MIRGKNTPAFVFWDGYERTALDRLGGDTPVFVIFKKILEERRSLEQKKVPLCMSICPFWRRESSSVGAGSTILEKEVYTYMHLA